ncbi:MAG: tRNA (guanosine(46)-N7)-methyltransferase TrmB [Alphaproteobacteria bacterium]|nr:tRNA (guanosine(46)-N7)-methyltransferase TrmB [Alphaproteobacteria bacterium]
MSAEKDQEAYRFFGRRKGHALSARREALVRDVLPGLRVTPPKQGLLDPRTLFDAPMARVHLEIGFGGGEHLAAQAKGNPEDGFIGCEVFLNGVASLVSQVADQEIGNVRIRDEDARPLLAAMAPASVDRIYVLFPDPWPKYRHRDRRMIQTESLDRFADMLKDGGELRVASDQMFYIAWTLERVIGRPDFEWLAERPGDWREPPADWVRTRYERKALAKGDHPAYLRFRRRPRDDGGQSRS